VDAFICYKQKCKVVSLIWPTLYKDRTNHPINQQTAKYELLVNMMINVYSVGANNNARRHQKWNRVTRSVSSSILSSYRSRVTSTDTVLTLYGA